jgi:transposase
MTDTMIEERRAVSKTTEWSKRIATQQRSGVSVKQFCKEQGLTECSFYAWRKRLRKSEPVRFALVSRGTAGRESLTDMSLELVLTTGERLRISAGVDATTLRTVLEVLRA